MRSGLPVLIVMTALCLPWVLSGCGDDVGASISGTTADTGTPGVRLDAAAPNDTTPNDTTADDWTGDDRTGEDAGPLADVEDASSESDVPPLFDAADGSPDSRLSQDADPIVDAEPGGTDDATPDTTVADGGDTSQPDDVTPLSDLGDTAADATAAMDVEETAEPDLPPPACPADCDDGDPCTVDTCQEPLGCIYTASAAACDDGNACTVDDTCADFACEGKQKVCNDGSSCTDDACDPDIGCIYLYNMAPCSDANPCTITDTCAGGECIGIDKPCSDGNPCTDDFCDVVQGCLHFDLDVIACDDGKKCTELDACVAGVCTGVEVPGCIPTCGDGVCVPDGGEACHTCAEDCGACAGDCCVDDGELGCEDDDVSACVCEVDPTCCTVLWDDTCALTAHTLCDASCDLCGNAFCDLPFGESCLTCPGDCGECVICGDGQCAPTESCATCPDDCGACDGSCCETNDTLGCEEPGLVLCVCSVDPVCCQGPWEQGCLDIALGPCGAYCPECGDLLCDPQPGVDETCETCPVDCGVCPP